MNRDSEIARKILEVIPPVMRMLRKEVRAGARGELTIPQLRILAHLFRGISTPNGLAELQGVSLPAISKMIELLEKRSLVRRRFKAEDRRQVVLSLTPKGKALFLKSRSLAQAKLSRQIEGLSEERKDTLDAGLQVLEELLERDE